MKTPPLTYERLTEVLRYDPITGHFLWNTNKSSKCKKDALAGNAGSHGYVQIMIDRVNYRGHRLAWLYMTGNWPENQIDHVNGIRSDNRWDNLRKATNQFNSENFRRANKNNECGFLGVHYLKSGKRTRRWMANIMVSGKHKFLGYYSTPEEAHQVYLSAKRELHAGCTI